MKNFVFILSAFILTLLASCEKPQANQSSSQSSTQLQKLPKDTTFKGELKEETAIDSDEELARIQKESSGEPNYAANILGYWEPGTRTKAFEETSNLLDELMELDKISELMSDHGLSLTTQQKNDLKSKKTKALQQFVYWANIRIEELTKKVDEHKELRDTTRAKAYESEIKLYQELMENLK